MKIRFLIYMMQVFILIGMQSCTKNFEEINTNPTTYNVGNFNPNTLLTTAQLTYSGSIDNSYDNRRSNFMYASAMVQLLASTTGWPGDKYYESDEHAHAYFIKAYPEQIKPIVELVEITKDKPEYKNLHQIGRLLKAMMFQRITDFYGDIPYFEAGMAYRGGVLYPKYDRQEVIYDDLFEEIEEASNALDLTADKPSGDAMFNGDIAKWKRFGNSLLLRASLRLIKVNPAKAKTIAIKTIGKAMENNADNAMVKGSGGYGDNAINNRNSRVLLGDVSDHFYTKWSKTFIDYLKLNNDPRLSKIAVIKVWTNTPTSTTLSGNANADPLLQRGLPNGKNTGEVVATSIYYDPSYTNSVKGPQGLNDYSSPNLLMAQRTAPTFFLTYAESEFLNAEAAVHWGAEFGDPAVHYNNGVKAAFSFLTQYDPLLSITDVLANQYLTAHPYNAANGLELINTQHWAHMATCFNFQEAWINWRRTGLPNLIPIEYPGNDTNGTIPRRYTYPLTENSNNEINLNIARSNIVGGDFITGRVWWDR